MTFQLQIDGPDDAFIPPCARDPGGYRVGIGPRGGKSGEATGRPDGVANRLEAGTHDDETGGDDADVHLDDGDGQRVDVGPWERLKNHRAGMRRKGAELALRVGPGRGIGVDHEDQPGDRAARVTAVGSAGCLRSVVSGATPPLTPSPAGSVP